MSNDSTEQKPSFGWVIAALLCAIFIVIPAYRAYKAKYEARKAVTEILAQYEALGMAEAPFALARQMMAAMKAEDDVLVKQLSKRVETLSPAARDSYETAITVHFALRFAELSGDQSIEVQKLRQMIAEQEQAEPTKPFAEIRRNLEKSGVINP